MLRFAHQEYLYLLLLIPVMLGIAILLYYRKKKIIGLLGDFALIEKLSETKSKYKYWVKVGLILLSLTFFIISLANPRIGTRYEEVHREGVDLIIALDVSYSMKAEDLKPSRLEKAKHELSSLITRLRGDRIGLIVFAGEAYVQLPLTVDYGAAQLLTDVVDENSAPTPGTSIPSAIEMAMQSFPKEEVQKGEKALVIITDGESHDEQSVKTAEEAAAQGIKIFTIGLGSPTGVPIPLYDKNGQQVDFKKDIDGKVVMTKLDEATLQKIAEVGGGKYYRGSNSEDELDMIYKEILQMEKKDLGMKQFTHFEDRFQYFIAIGLFLLLLEFFLSEKKWKWFSKFNIFKA
jgi:Ca-activated chloride channel family protein